MTDRLDHGIVNLPLHKRGAGSLDAQIDREIKRIKAEKEALRKVLIEENRKRDIAVPFTREQYEAAKAVRTSSGWYRVVKVNPKSVLVETGYSWSDRVPLAKVLEVRS